MALATQKLNRQSVSVQVRDDLRRRIAAGEIASGDQLMSEHECAEAYGVSRASVREAYRLLEQEGLIVVRRGFGRFVLPNAQQQMAGSMTLFSSMTDFLVNAGYVPGTRVLSVVTRLPTTEECEALRLPAYRPVVYLERFRLGDGVPLVYSQSVFDARLLPGGADETDWSGSTIAMFAARGHRVLSSVMDVQAVNLPAEVAAEHALSPCAPWLLLVGISFDAKGNPFLLSRDWVRGDIRTLHVVQRG